MNTIIQLSTHTHRPYPLKHPPLDL